MKVIAIVAQSVDGFIARRQDHLADWTSKEDKKLFVELTKKAGVIVMGANTFNTIGKALPGRRNIVYSRQPITAENIETTSEDPAKLLQRLKLEGHNEVAIIGGQQIYKLFFEHKLVTELFVTYEPVIFGSGMSLMSSSAEIQLELIEYRKLNANALMAHYKVLYGDSN